MRKLIFNDMIWFFYSKEVDIFVTFDDRVWAVHWGFHVRCFAVNLWSFTTHFDTLCPSIEANSLWEGLIRTNNRRCHTIRLLYQWLLKAWHQHALFKCLQRISFCINLKLNRVFPACICFFRKRISSAIIHYNVLFKRFLYHSVLCNAFRVITGSFNSLLYLYAVWILLEKTKWVLRVKGGGGIFTVLCHLRYWYVMI